jgi:type I restriction enzyme S subunit
VKAWGAIKRGYTHFSNGDVGLAKITPCFENGKSTVFNDLTGGIGAGTTELHIVRPLLINPFYILIFLKSAHFLSGGVPVMTGTAGQKRVSAEYFKSAQFPLPPLPEQHRIVAQVDQLMALCDQLEARQAKRESLRDRAGTAALIRLTADDGANFRAQAQFYLANFHRLITRPKHLVEVRRAILDLAVRGRLAAQYSSDESVAQTLSQSDRTRASVAKADRRADAANQVVILAEERWRIPETWCWRGLADLVLFIDYRGRTPTKQISGVRLITAKNVRRRNIVAQPEEFISEVDYDRWMTRGIPQPGDILFTTEAPMGNAAVVKDVERFALAQRVIDMRSYGAIDPEFMVLQLLSDPFHDILVKASTGLTAKGIKAAKLKRLPVAVPPVAEQRRIVAKVSQLMAVCDELEEYFVTMQSGQARLLEATLRDVLEGRRAEQCGLVPA